jgi:hypothetical protein
MAKLPTGWSSGGPDPVKKQSGKNHEADIKKAEGLAFGKKHSGGNHDKVAMHAPMNMKAQKSAQAAHERRENGGANPTGCC